jgi:predicted HD phosphohydrolase
MLTRLWGLFKTGLTAGLTRRSYDMRPAAPTEPEDIARERFDGEAQLITRRHQAQSREDVARLRSRYERPVYGRVEMWTLLERLGGCIDPTDTRLYGASQHLHLLQVLSAMEADGVTDANLLLAALIHDVGKILLLIGERPENVVCFNEPIGEHEPGIGLDCCVLQWNHDEFGYSRLKDHVPDAVSWLVRYHSIKIDRCAPLMDARDLAYTERYLRTFQRYDQDSKSLYVIPKRTLWDYRERLEKSLPRAIIF